MSTYWYIHCYDCDKQTEWYGNRAYKETFNLLNARNEITALVNKRIEFLNITFFNSHEICFFIAAHNEHQLCVLSEYGDKIFNKQDLEYYCKHGKVNRKL